MSGSFTSATYSAARKAFVAKKGKTGFVACESPLAPLLTHKEQLANNVVPAYGLLSGAAAAVNGGAAKETPARA